MAEIGENAIRHRLARGDYIDPIVVSSVEAWLRVKDEERLFDEACERAAKSAALDTKSATRTANLALIVSAIAACISALCAFAVFFKSCNGSE